MIPARFGPKRPQPHWDRTYTDATKAQWVSEFAKFSDIVMNGFGKTPEESHLALQGMGAWARAEAAKYPKVR